MPAGFDPVFEGSTFERAFFSAASQIPEKCIYSGHSAVAFAFYGRNVSQVINVNKMFTQIKAKTLDTRGKMYYIIGGKVSTLVNQVLKQRKGTFGYG